MYHAKILYDFHNINKKIERADFILAMGSHDTRTAYKAAQLYRKGRADFIICTGGYGKITKNLWNKTEAEIFAEICIKEGVSSDKIIIENKASNSGDNFQFSKKIFEEKSIVVKKGIIVCKNYLARRAISTARKQWSEVDWYIETPRLSFENYPNEEVPLERMINLMVGDIERLIFYAEKRFQVSVEIPKNVLKSYEYLKNQGFNEYILK
ncbi:MULTISPECIES: YdcF family protein [unclassified Gemella]|uniref:YdcF family protein n=1 Tax=unclassified Gemella TaxID=2624949 RepID=UPI001ADDE598|nr:MULTISPECIES: YdcF family protein [unclassified Gemella]